MSVVGRQEGAGVLFGSLLFDFDQVVESWVVWAGGGGSGQVARGTGTGALWCVECQGCGQYLGFFTLDLGQSCSCVPRWAETILVHDSWPQCSCLRPLQVEWLRTHISKVPIRLVFESALELMGTTQVGTC